MLVEAAAGGPAYVLPTAARRDPARAVANARGWFGGLGCAMEELPVLSRRDAQSAAVADRAAEGRLFYLVGGDPGHLLRVLEGSRVWRVVEAAWRAGAALAGSSAGAMVLGDQVLLRDRWPSHQRRRAVPGLRIVPGVAVVPHYDGGGTRWTTDGAATLLGVDERTAALWRGGDGWRVSGPGRVVVDGAVHRQPGRIPVVASPRT